MTAVTDAAPRTRGTRAVDLIARIASSRWFFVAIVAVFGLSSLWIAWSARLTLLYDEQFHLAIIDIYSHQLSPFISHQAKGSAGLGDIQRESYLFHYLMSFPDRVLRAIGAGEYVRVAAMRTLTVAMATASLYWFRKALLETGVSRAVAHTAILVFAALPMSSFVAATVNYDNLMQLLGAIYLWLAVRAFLARTVTINLYAGLIALGAFASLTKNPFLVVFAVTFVMVVVRQVIIHRHTREWIPRLSRAGRFGTVGAVILLLVTALAIALFVERFGINIAAYHSATPDCSAIHSVSFCRHYAPWERNYLLDQGHADQPLSIAAALGFALRVWIPNMVTIADLLGVVGMPTSFGPAITQYLILVGAVVWVGATLLTIGVIVKRRGFILLGSAAVVTLAALFVVNFSQFQKFGSPVAIQSRYLMVVATALFAAGGYGLSIALDRLYVHARAVKAVIFVVLIVAVTQGGFALAFANVAQASWFAPQSPFAGMNHLVLALARLIVQ